MGVVASTRSGQPRHDARPDHRVARARYVDPEPVPNSLELREVSEQAAGHDQVLGAKTKRSPERGPACPSQRLARRCS